MTETYEDVWYLGDEDLEDADAAIDESLGKLGAVAGVLKGLFREQIQMQVHKSVGLAVKHYVEEGYTNIHFDEIDKVAYIEFTTDQEFAQKKEPLLKYLEGSIECGADDSALFRFWVAMRDAYKQFLKAEGLFDEQV